MAEIVYSTGQAAEMLGVTNETIRIWSREFDRHLSPGANPVKGRHRTFTRTDIEVLALVADLKNEGLRLEDIHANLESGQRGIFPEVVEDSPLSGMNAQIALQTIRNLETQLVEANQELEDLRTVRDENIRLQNTVSMSREQIDKLENRIEALTTKIEELSIKAGEQYARGYVDGLKADTQQKDDKPTDSQLQ